MKSNWRQPAVQEYINFLEKNDRKQTMLLMELNPDYKPSQEDIENGIVLKELAKVALKDN